MFFTDPSKNPSMSITQRRINQLVEQGCIYTVQHVIKAIPAGQIVDIFFDLSAFTKNSLYLIESIYFISSGSGVGTFYLPGSTASGGTAITAYNRNEILNGLPQSAISYKTNELATNIGAALPTSYQIGAESIPVSAGAGAKGDEFLTKVKPSISRVLRIEHTGNAAFNLDIRLIFAEIP